MKKSRLIIITAAVIILIAAGGFAYYSSGLGAPEPGNTDPVTVEIPSGTGASAIVEILDENGLVKNKTAAKIHVRLAGYDSLQANSYIFNKDMTLKEIMEVINTGDFNYLSKNAFTIIEGATAPQAAEAIAESLPFTAEDLLKKWKDRDYLNQLIDQYWFLTDEILQDGILYPLEGYLYPETYFVTDDEPTEEEITEMLLDMTDQVLSERKEGIEAMDLTVHQFLSLASVVENESLFEKDRPLIAGVFINRLAKDMPLQSDITDSLRAAEKEGGRNLSGSGNRFKVQYIHVRGPSNRPCILSVVGNDGRRDLLRKVRLPVLLRYGGRGGHLLKDIGRTREGGR